MLLLWTMTPTPPPQSDSYSSFVVWLSIACSTLALMLLMTCNGSGGCLGHSCSTRISWQTGLGATQSGTGAGLTIRGWDTRQNHLMYPSECFHLSSSGTGSTLSCWLTTYRENSMKEAATSAGARGRIVVGGRGTI